MDSYYKNASNFHTFKKPYCDKTFKNREKEKDAFKEIKQRGIKISYNSWCTKKESIPKKKAMV